MTKAESVANKAYPPEIFKGEVFDQHRLCIILGYHKAEQDLALTWEDMKRICALSVLVEMELGRKASDEQLYEEVLQLFNSYREVKK